MQGYGERGTAAAKAMAVESGNRERGIVRLKFFDGEVAVATVASRHPVTFIRATAHSGGMRLRCGWNPIKARRGGERLVRARDAKGRLRKRGGDD